MPRRPPSPLRHAVPVSFVPQHPCLLCFPPPPSPLVLCATPPSSPASRPHRWRPHPILRTGFSAHLCICVEIHTKKRNRLTCERVEQLVFVRFNHLHAKTKNKAQKNKKTDPLVANEATFVQGWMVQGADEEGSDVEPATGLTWKLIAETCGDEEVRKLRRSARLAHAREIEEPLSESEQEAINEEDVEFESDQDDVVTTGYEQEGEEDIDG